MSGTDGQPPTSTQLTAAEPYTPDAEAEYRLDEKHRAKLHEIIAREVQRTQERLNRDDINETANRAERKAESVLRRLGHKAMQLVRRVRLFAAMLRDAASTDFGVPVYTIAGIAFSLLYFTLPMDMIPDFLPMMGLTDDAFVFSVVGNLFRRDLDRYIAWKKLNPADYFRDAEAVVTVKPPVR